MPPRLPVLALALLPLAAQALEVTEGSRDTEAWITAADGSVTRIYGAAQTLTVARATAPLTADDLAAAIAAAGDHCAAQGAVLEMSATAEPVFEVGTGVWTLFAWCAAPG